MCIFSQNRLFALRPDQDQVRNGAFITPGANCTAMILEETLIFHSEEDASVFLEYLKERGVRAKKSNRGYSTAETVITCSLDGYISWLSAVAGDYAASQGDGSPLPYPCSETDLRVFEQQLDLLQRTLVKLEELLMNKTIGDVVYTKDQVQKAIMALLSRPQGDAEALFFDPGEYDVWIPIDIIFRENHVVVDSPDGYRLDMTVDPGSLLYTSSFNPDSPELRKRTEAYNPTFRKEYYVSSECTVNTDPALYLCDEMHAIPDIISSLSVDDASRDTFLENYYLKRQILAMIMTIVAHNESVSLIDLSREIACFSIPADDGSEGCTIHLDPSIAKILVDELIAAKLLSGTNRLLKFGKAMRKKG